MSLQREVIQEDHRLERASEGAAEALMRHRWHWTLDESNPERVSIKEYARAIGKRFSVVHKDARGYELFTDHEVVVGPSEARERAGMSAEKEAVTEAVAEAHGIGFTQARQTRHEEIREVRADAREAAEEKGTSVEEEAQRIAEWNANVRRGEAKRREERRQKHTHRWIEANAELAKARDRLRRVLKLARSVEFDDEERDLLVDDVDGLRALLGLIDMALVGETDVDWDAELAKITKEDR